MNDEQRQTEHACNTLRNYLAGHISDMRPGYAESTARAIRALHIASEWEPEDVPALFDSGAFNKITAGYCLKALEGVELDDNTKRAIMANLWRSFDTCTASGALEMLAKTE